MNRYFGKYRGKVENNVDPMKLGRLQISAPAVLGEGRQSWALPCVPFAGKGVGLFMLPPVNTNIWVEFEGGDPDFPIWSGCFWGQEEIPTPLPLEQTKVFKTTGVTLTLSELPGAGGITLEVSPPVVPLSLKIALGASGIELTSGGAKISMSAVSVNVNNGALEVT